MKVINALDLPSPLIRQRRVKKTSVDVFHCNGIFCVTGDFKTLALCCPLTGTGETFHPKCDNCVSNHDIIGMGFGSDSDGTKFKVVRILDSMRAQVFAPRSSDSWREFKICDRRIPYQVVYQHVYCNGHCFWIVIDFYIQVLCFDVVKETFRETYLPDGLSLSGYTFKLSTLNNSVRLFSCSYSKIRIWVLDIDEKPCWRRLLKIEASQGFRSPLAFWGEEELLMETENGNLTLYNIRTHERKSVSSKRSLGSVLYSGVYVKEFSFSHKEVFSIRTRGF